MEDDKSGHRGTKLSTAIRQEKCPGGVMNIGVTILVKYCRDERDIEDMTP